MVSLLMRGLGIAGIGLAVACSDDADQGTADGHGTNGSLGGSGGSPSVGTGGSGDGSEGQASRPLEPPEDWVGNIVAQRTRAFVADKSAVYIDFAKEGMEAYGAVVGPVSSSCTTAEYGSCKRTQCVYETPGPGTISVPPDMLPVVVQLEAGTIEVTSATSSGAISFSAKGEPDAESQLYSATAIGSLEGGEVLSVNASGGSVESFATTLVMPLAPLLLSPAAPAGATGVVQVPVAKSNDLVLAWDARGAAHSVWIVPRMPGNVDFSFTCRFDAAQGTGTVSRDALAELPSGTELHLFAENYTTLETSDGTVLVEALGELLSSDQAASPLFLVQ